MTEIRRPPAPHPAERARTIATRGGRAALLPPDGAEDRVVPELHHVHPCGEATLLLPDEHPLVARAALGEVTSMLEVADHAAVPLREPVRGLLWITGWLRALDGPAAREACVEVAEERPDPRLLDVGHGLTALRLVPASLVVADAETTTSLRPEVFAQAEPDPFCAHEDHWLRHLELSHRDVVGLLVQHLPEGLRGGHVRPLGLDRFGLRLRVELADADHDVRIAFSRPVATPSELSSELRRLMGCPFLAQRR
ncbi:DUF2470 domain-containing protein [Actinosynnema pretiosum]|uniref:DUF2470 domain-containing protein n=1 Tax=Actinosynnema pretiosum TaxID=42197 RepID=A0A290YYT4_9PSEU|nr:DUF2470 domain-containing protein [Actinosynnema pretiosum]ATE51941.1 DUF2470 domain-containing protein [Actinosynnema pretiosum]